MSDSDIIHDGHMVIAQMHDREKSTNMLFISSKGDQKVGRSKISVRKAIGNHYGSVFQVVKRKLEKVSADDDFVEGILQMSDPLGIQDDTNVTGDNRNYVDTNTAQKLDSEDILNMKESGVSGVDIIKNLIANSETWGNKTVFSQEKWLRKKLKQHVCKMRLIKCTPASLCEVYHGKNREKICGLRWDSLSQILSHSGIHAGRRVLIVESCIGMVVGSAAYRMRGQGRILAMYGGQQPHFEMVENLNLDKSFSDIIQPIPSNELAPAADYVKKFGFLELEDDVEAQQPVQMTGSTSIHPKPYLVSGRSGKHLSRVRSMLRRGAESLIIATRFNPLSILMEALTLLAPCSPVVVYHEYLEPLLPCYNYLLQHERAVRVVLADTWMREFQVLPGRCHPQMRGSGSGGYLLYATFIKNGEATVEPSVPDEVVTNV